MVRLSGRAIRGEGNAAFFVLFAEDVTEQRALEQQLRRAQKMEAVGRLAGGIAHDFNNLLMVISGYCEFLLERIGSDVTLRGSVQEIGNAAERATSLTRQLLAFSRKQMLARKVLDLNAVVKGNLKMLTRMIGEDIDLVMIAGAGIGAVKADPGQIDQVIMNLVVNARDAMPHGGKLTIEIADITCDEEYARSHPPLTMGEYVMLAISDTGLGMDAATQLHIFEPFFTTKGLKGTGLGLSTVYGIIQQSRGYIHVSSEPGKGTSFKIYLPRVGATGQAIPREPSIAIAKPEQAVETILLAEDESSLRNLARQFLESQGYTVLEAAEGAAAIQICNSHPGPIHLLLTDLIMPGINGRELARRVCAMRPETKVLYMSGYAENAIANNAMLEEGIPLLQKPFSLSTLRTKVREKLSPASRAQRFNLQLPLKYRLLGESVWRNGTTENISRSGMLLRVEETIQPNAQLEINLVLPAEIAGLSTAEVICHGEVVRTVELEQPIVGPALAARILRYQFPPGSQQRPG
jgi:nitrogen-specific signal transduction histidine kinase/DNA-binding response OmpR family regulator